MAKTMTTGKINDSAVNSIASLYHPNNIPASS
jgi:hypothetical protein